LFKIIEAMDQFLKEDPTNVVAVHCLAGRGRTGTIIAAYLLYSKLFDDSKAALDFFAIKRSSEGQGVIGPSQVWLRLLFIFLANLRFTDEVLDTLR